MMDELPLGPRQEMQEAMDRTQAAIRAASAAGEKLHDSVELQMALDHTAALLLRHQAGKLCDELARARREAQDARAAAAAKSPQLSFLRSPPAVTGSPPAVRKELVVDQTS